MGKSDYESDGAYKAREMNSDRDKEIARLGNQVQWTWEKEARNLGWFGLRDGMAILEVGSGPGFVTEQLLLLCPTSHVTCVELDPEEGDIQLPGEGGGGHRLPRPGLSDQEELPPG